MTDSTNPLLDAVDALTKQQTVANWQRTHEHLWEKCACPDPDCKAVLCNWCDTERTDLEEPEPAMRMARRTDKPLLDWLAESIRSNVGGNGSGKQARERTPVDLAALELYEEIDGRIRAWLLDLGAPPVKDAPLSKSLRGWYVLHNQRPDVYEWHYTAVLKRWAEDIKDKIDPPKRIEITAPCPECGSEWVNRGLKLDNGEDDPNDIERVRALTAMEREDLDDSYAMCSACLTVWKGVWRMRSLRIAIDDAARRVEVA